MKALTGISLLLVILLVSLSAYLRLSHSGIGCDDWPQCYGQIGAAADTDQSASGQDAYGQLLEQSSQALWWATPLHRLVASVLGIFVIILNGFAIRQKRHRLMSLSLLVLTVGLAILGIRSGSLHDPAVVMGNLLGGFTMLGLLGCLWFGMTSRDQASNPPELPKFLPVLAIVLLAGQIIMGGLTSANFAATSCQSIPDCHGSWWPGPELFNAFDLRSEHQVTSTGQAIGGMERVAIHQAHRLGALLTASVILLTGILAIKTTGPTRKVGIVITFLIILEFSVGIASVLSGLPIALAVAHNWLSALLLLSLLNMYFLQTKTLSEPGESGIQAA